MKKMKKLALLLVLTLLCSFVLTGCGSEQPAESSESEESSEVSVIDVEDIVPDEYLYALTVTINPTVELFIDADDSIVGIKYLNDDAKDAYGALDLVGSKLDAGLQTMIDSVIDKEYLKEDMPVSVELTEVKDVETVVPDTKLTELQTIVSSHIAEKETFSWTASVETAVSEEVSELAAPSANVCDACNGTGNDCEECGGRGIVHCKRCVNGHETCGTCQGSGNQRCNGCKGAGKDDHGGVCRYCGGKGTTTCEQCHGSGGWDDCSWCHGALEHVCPVCEGEKVCAKCGGTGELAA